MQSRWNSSFAPRRGKGVEPTTADEQDETDQQQEQRPREGEEQRHEAAEGKDADAKMPSADTSHSNTTQIKSVVKLEEDQVSKDEEIPKHKLNPRKSEAPSGESSTADETAQGDSSNATSESSSEPDTEPLDPKTRQARDDAKSSGPLEAVLHMEPPAQVAKQHPTMSAKPYVHHFDSYSLVKQLQDGGYSPRQAIESMKGIRALLAQNLDVAQESLVSKSDVENVSC